MLDIPSVSIENMSEALCAVRGLNPSTPDGSWEKEARQAIEKILVSGSRVDPKSFDKLFGTQIQTKKKRGFGHRSH